MQYIQPFSTVSLASMSSATGIAVDPLLSEIEDLLEKGKLKGKIDLIDKVSCVYRTTFSSKVQRN